MELSSASFAWRSLPSLPSTSEARHGRVRGETWASQRRDMGESEAKYGRVRTENALTIECHWN
eukprot:1233469-Prymnesium_polylepis.2